MITREILAANAATAGLNEDQINAILTMSANDVSAEIGKKTGEIYRAMDTSIETVTGVKRNGDEKTYLYLERAMKQVKSENDSSALQAQVASLTAEKTRLEEEIKKGGGEEIKNQLNQVKAELANTKNQFNELQTKYNDREKEHQNEIFGVRVENELAVASQGIKFKPEFPQSVVNILLQQAYAKVKSMHPDFIDNGAGGKVLVFRGEDQAILNNPENKLNPYTAGELLQKELKEYLAPVRRQGGTGSQDPDHQEPSLVDVSSARTRTEAHEIITKQLLAKGLAYNSAEFQKEMDKAWVDNNISKLPEK